LACDFFFDFRFSFFGLSSVLFLDGFFVVSVDALAGGGGGAICPDEVTRWVGVGSFSSSFKGLFIIGIKNRKVICLELKLQFFAKFLRY